MNNTELMQKYITYILLRENFVQTKEELGDLLACGSEHSVSFKLNTDNLDRKRVPCFFELVPAYYHTLRKIACDYDWKLKFDTDLNLFITPSVNDLNNIHQKWCDLFEEITIEEFTRVFIPIWKP